MLIGGKFKEKNGEFGVSVVIFCFRKALPWTPVPGEVRPQGQDPGGETY